VYRIEGRPREQQACGAAQSDPKPQDLEHEHLRIPQPLAVYSLYSMQKHPDQQCGCDGPKACGSGGSDKRYSTFHSAALV
jgi:hypothetical protein